MTKAQKCILLDDLQASGCLRSCARLALKRNYHLCFSASNTQCSQTVEGEMAVRDIVKTGAYYALGAAVRARAAMDRKPYLSGAFPTLETTKASLPHNARSGYDSDEMTEVALEMMLGMLG